MGAPRVSPRGSFRSESPKRGRGCPRLRHLRKAWLAALTGPGLLGCATEPLEGSPAFWARDFPTLEASSPLREQSAAQTPRSRYVIDVSLDADRHELSGKETILWVNHSRREVRALPFHLYLNAFRRGSRFLDERYGGSRSGGLSGREGKMTVVSLTSPAFPDQDLWRRASSHSPGYPEDETDITVPLPTPVAPGETLTLELAFHAKLPRIVERTGFSGDFHLLGQWFPKLAKLEPTGEFDHDSFHPYAEFYSDFADYDVTLRVPSGALVASTGRLERRGQEGGVTTYVSTAERVVDFAWTVYPGARLVERDLHGTHVRVLVPRTSPRSLDLHLSTLDGALAEFRRDYGPYPYPSLSVVQPPAHAIRAGGMEYPGFITTGGSELGAILGTRQTELLVAHELGHQWFQSLIATNERRYPFLDEGLTSYAEWRYLSRTFGPTGLLGTPWFALSREAGGRFSAFYGDPPEEPLNQPAADFESFRSLAAHVYGRTPLVLLTLGRVYGAGKLTAGLAEYARRFRYRHPEPQDLRRVLQKHLGRDARVPLRRLFDEPGGFDVRLGKVATVKDGTDYATRLDVTMNRKLGLPIEVLVEFVDGSHTRLRVAGKERTERLSIRHPVPVARISVDPDHRLLIDVDPRNNTRSLTSKPPAPRFHALLRAAIQLFLQVLRP